MHRKQEVYCSLINSLVFSVFSVLSVVKSLKQFLDRRAVLHDLDRPTDVAVILVARVDAQGPAEGAEQILHREGPFDHLDALLVGGTDDLPAPADDEVAEYAWVSEDSLRAAVAGAPFGWSPWLGWQLTELEAAGLHITR